VRLKQARAEVLEEISAYKEQCDEQCMKQENEACISNQNQIKFISGNMSHKSYKL